MIDLREALPILFYYDHASGITTARLPNGTKIPLDARDINGRLGNALKLHSRQVIALNSGKYIQARGSKGELVYEYDESQIRRFKGRKELPPSLDLELKLEDLL